MGQIVIFRNGIEHLHLVERSKRTIQSATLSRQLLSDDSISLKLLANSVLDIKVNDYFVKFGNTYRINALPEFNKINNSFYEYSVVGQGVMYDLQRVKFFNADASGFKTDLDFPLIGNLETFLTVLKANMQRLSIAWDFAPIIGFKDVKTMAFGSDNCLSALQRICQEFKTEFWVKAVGNKYVINTGSFGSTTPLVFEYGKGKGLYSLSRNNVDENGIVNRVFVSGGSDNLPSDYRGFSKSLKLPEVDYLEDVAMIDDMGLKEGEFKFDEIYPSRTGKITGLGDTKFKFKDSTMDFDLNEKEADGTTTKFLKPDTTAKIHFITGNLAGYEFEIKKGGYKHDTTEFEIIPIITDSGQKIPDAETTAFQFALNDEYVLLDIYAPEIYITNAENRLLAKAKEQFAIKKQAQVSYSLKISEDFIKALPAGLDVGDYVRVIDTPLAIDKVIRINSITRNFIQDSEFVAYDYNIVIADTYVIDFNSQMFLDIKEVKTTNTIIDGGQINYSLIGAKNTRELQSMTFDSDGYLDATNIKPGSIETGMLSVGSRSQQLSLSVVFLINADGDFNKIMSKAGKLFSQTLEKSWDIAATSLIIPDNNARYVYGKCSKTSSAGSISYSKDQIKFDENPNDYYFLLGVLHSVVEGSRVLSLTYGTTTINGGLIRTGIISSMDGQTYLNLDNGKFKGKIEFSDDSEAFNQVSSGGENLLITDDFGDTYFDIEGNPYKNEETDYVIGFDTKNEVVRKANIYVVIKDLAGSYIVRAEKAVTLKGFNERLSIKFKEKLANIKLLFVQLQDAGTDQEIEIDKIKLEKGSIATSYSPSYIDTNSKIEEFEKSVNWFSTTVSGNNIATGTLLLGNNETGTNAGITGVGGENDIFLFAGSSYADRELAPIRFYRNGTGFLRNVTVRGEIIAESGRIGGDHGWVIGEKEIQSSGGRIIFGKYNQGGLEGGLLIGDNIYGKESGVICNIVINNDLPSEYFHLGASISAKNGQFNTALFLSAPEGVGNNALDIESGNVRVSGKSGFTGIRRVEKWDIEVTKGIITNMTYMG